MHWFWDLICSRIHFFDSINWNIYFQYILPLQNVVLWADINLYTANLITNTITWKHLHFETLLFRNSLDATLIVFYLESPTNNLLRRKIVFWSTKFSLQTYFQLYLSCRAFIFWKVKFFYKKQRHQQCFCFSYGLNNRILLESCQ